jgi:hypothetical protein
MLKTLEYMLNQLNLKKLPRQLDRNKDRNNIIILLAMVISINLLISTSVRATISEDVLDEAETYAEGIPASKMMSPPPAPFKEGICILISIRDQHCWLYKDGVPIESSPVSTGKRGKETPQGDFYVINRHRDWTSTIYHRPMPYFLRLNPGDFGLHQGVLGSKPSSNGCIRLPEGLAKTFFDLSPIGTKVRIEG